jgi:hypothetical protein
VTLDDKKRANSLLVTLLFAGGAGQARALRDELESVHGVVATLDRVRADLAWLADVGLVQRIDDTVALTEEGRDVASGRRRLP